MMQLAARLPSSSNDSASDASRSFGRGFGIGLFLWAGCLHGRPPGGRPHDRLVEWVPEEVGYPLR